MPSDNPSTNERTSAVDEISILVTNDDGIQAEGIRVLAHALQDIGTVHVVAPDRERSATGHAITVHQPLRVDEFNFADGIKAYQVNGTPSDCIKIGVEALLGRRPNFVVSGINRGPNLGTDVIYSGTVSAAVEGTILGIPSIAVSLAAFTDCDYSHAGLVAKDVVQRLMQAPLPVDTLLNINVPNLPAQDIKGTKVVRLGLRRYEDIFDERKDPWGRRYYWLAGNPIDSDTDTDSDAAEIKQGFVTMTPVHFDLTNYKVMETLQHWTS